MSHTNQPLSINFAPIFPSENINLYIFDKCKSDTLGSLVKKHYAEQKSLQSYAVVLDASLLFDWRQITLCALQVFRERNTPSKTHPNFPTLASEFVYYLSGGSRNMKQNWKAFGIQPNSTQCIVVVFPSLMKDATHNTQLVETLIEKIPGTSTPSLPNSDQLTPNTITQLRKIYKLSAIEISNHSNIIKSILNRIAMS